MLGRVPGKGGVLGGLLGAVLGGHFLWKNRETALLPAVPPARTLPGTLPGTFGGFGIFSVLLQAALIAILEAQIASDFKFGHVRRGIARENWS